MFLATFRAFHTFKYLTNQNSLFDFLILSVFLAFSVAIDGNYTNYVTGEKMSFSKNQKITFKPWEYKILIAE